MESVIVVVGMVAIAALAYKAMHKKNTNTPTQGGGSSSGGDTGDVNDVVKVKDTPSKV